MESLELIEFRDLMAAIRNETDLMKKVILSEEEEKEENEILCKFKSVAETQVLSTIVKLAAYQLREWRELIDGSDYGEDGNGDVRCSE